MNNWISVDERLPEEDGNDVLVYNPGYVGSGIYVAFYAAAWYSATGHGRLLHVTHWMPLPEAPTKD